MSADSIDLARAAVVAVLEHHIPAQSPESVSERVASLVLTLAEEIAADLAARGVTPASADVELYLAVFAAESLVPAVIESLRLRTMTPSGSC